MDNPIITHLNWRYDAFLKCWEAEKFNFKAYYNSIYEYMDVIEKHPELQKIIEADKQAVQNQIEKIDSDKSVSIKDRKEQITKIKHFSFSDRHGYIHERVYAPMHEYITTTKKNLRGCVLTAKDNYDGFAQSVFRASILYSVGKEDKAKMEIYRFQYHEAVDLFKENMQKLHTALTDIIIQFEHTPERISIIIDDKKGIHRADNDQLFYGIKKSSNRMKLIKHLATKDNCSITELEDITSQDKSVVMKSILDINELFREKLKLTDDLILHFNTGGYSLNKDVFDITIQ